MQVSLWRYPIYLFLLYLFFIAFRHWRQNFIQSVLRIASSADTVQKNTHYNHVYKQANTYRAHSVPDILTGPLSTSDLAWRTFLCAYFSARLPHRVKRCLQLARSGWECMNMPTQGTTPPTPPRTRSHCHAMHVLSPTHRTDRKFVTTVARWVICSRTERSALMSPPKWLGPRLIDFLPFDSDCAGDNVLPQACSM